MSHHKPSKEESVFLPSTWELAALSRREALRRGLLTAAGLFAAGSGLNALAAVEPKAQAGALAAAGPNPRAKAVIQIWMWGGPSHLDTFDPKPEAGYDYCGPLKTPIETNVSGIRICELLPLLAKQADKYSIIRGMTHGNNSHETAAYMVQTGRPSGGRDVFPCAGAVVSYLKLRGGYRGLIPPYIVLTEPQGRFSEAGFLGSRHKPFATGGDPGAAKFMVEGVVAPGITEQRQRARRGLLESLDTLQRDARKDAQMVALAESENQAYDLILGSAGKVFDLTEEKDTLRDGYGRNTFGQSCLMARRLVERGVPYITINYRGGWDTHKDNFTTMRRRLPEMDKGFSALLNDLSERGLLDSTMVWWGGEFGRTPKVQWEAPWNGGRGHHGQVFSSVVAGGGFKGGHVVGASDARGEKVAERPVYPADLIASMYELLGIAPESKLPHPQGLAVQAVPSVEENVKMAGKLKEIM